MYPLSTMMQYVGEGKLRVQLYASKEPTHCCFAYVDEVLFIRVPFLARVPLFLLG